MGRRCDDRRARDGSSSYRGVLPGPADRSDPGLFRRCQLPGELVPALALRAGGPVRGGRRGDRGDLVHATGRALDCPSPRRPALEGPGHDRPEGLAWPGGAGSRRRTRALGRIGGFNGRPRVRATLHFAKAPPGHRGGDTRGSRRAWHRPVRGARLRLGFGNRARRRPGRRRPRLGGPRRRIARLEESLPARSLARRRMARRSGGARGRCRESWRRAATTRARSSSRSIPLRCRQGPVVALAGILVATVPSAVAPVPAPVHAEAPRGRGVIAFDRVTVTYPGASAPALANVSLAIEEGHLRPRHRRDRARGSRRCCAA